MSSNDSKTSELNKYAPEYDEHDQCTGVHKNKAGIFYLDSRVDELVAKLEARIKELEDMIPKDVRDKGFSCFMYNAFTEDDMKINGGYHHPTYKANMLLSKGGVQLKLNPSEIKGIVCAAGGSFKR